MNKGFDSMSADVTFYSVILISLKASEKPRPMEFKAEFLVGLLPFLVERVLRTDESGEEPTDSLSALFINPTVVFII